jgi:ABC-type phosphate transport system substrate-binding protein
MYSGTLPCTTETWAALSSTTAWPESCKGAGLSSVVKTPTNGDDGAMVEAVNTTPGSIGYAPGTVIATASHVLALQNNGQVAAAEAEFAAPTIGKEANCGATQYSVPAGARRKNGEPATNVDWSGVSGAHPAIGGSSYPLCMLTYDLAFRGYKGTGIPFSKEVTVRDYIKWYITVQGQEAVEGLGYAPLPTAAESSKNVLGSAQYTAGKINY